VVIKDIRKVTTKDIMKTVTKKIMMVSNVIFQVTQAIAVETMAKSHETTPHRQFCRCNGPM
jgi:hypothetical protein